MRFLLTFLTVLFLMSSQIGQAEAEVRLRPGEREMREATRLMAEGRCDRAIPLLRRAHEVAGVRNALWNIAECYGLLDRPGLAIETYREYLEHPATRARENDREATLRAIAELEASVAEVIIEASLDGAEVRVDGRVVGETPLETLIGQGLHTVEVGSAGFSVWRQEIQLEPGDERRLSAVLELLPGRLEVASNPTEAAVEIDGEPAGRTPWSGELSGGRHLLTISVPNYRVEERAVTVTPGATSSLNVSLTPTGGVLAVATDAQAASLRIDGEARGESPFAPLDLRPGRYELLVYAGGRAPWQGAVEVLDGRTTTVELDLARSRGVHQAWFWAVSALAVASLVAGVTTLVMGQRASEDYDRLVASIQTGGDGTEELTQRQREGEAIAAEATGLLTSGIVLSSVGSLAAIGAVVLGFFTRFRDEVSAANIRFAEEASGAGESEVAP